MHLSEINKYDHGVNVYFRQWGINDYGPTVVILLQLLLDCSFSRCKQLTRVKLCTYLTNVMPQILFASTPFQDSYTKQCFEIINQLSLLQPGRSHSVPCMSLICIYLSALLSAYPVLSLVCIYCRWFQRQALERIHMLSTHPLKEWKTFLYHLQILLLIMLGEKFF